MGECMQVHLLQDSCMVSEEMPMRSAATQHQRRGRHWRSFPEQLTITGVGTWFCLV